MSDYSGVFVYSAPMPTPQELGETGDSVTFPAVPLEPDAMKRAMAESLLESMVKDLLERVQGLEARVKELEDPNA